MSRFVAYSRLFQAVVQVSDTVLDRELESDKVILFQCSFITLKLFTTIFERKPRRAALVNQTLH